MLEAIVYNYLLFKGREKVTFDDLVAHLASQLKNDDVRRGSARRWKALEVIGGMIANRDITITDDGSVKIA